MSQESGTHKQKYLDHPIPMHYISMWVTWTWTTREVGKSNSEATDTGERRDQQIFQL